MHVLQPKHTKISQEEAKSLLSRYKIALSQLPKIKSTDPALPENAKISDIIKIERKNDSKSDTKSDTKKIIFYRVVVA